MAFRRSGNRGSTVVVGRSQRKTQWVGSDDQLLPIVLAAATATLDQSFTISSPRTIVRTRGSLWVASDQNAAIETPFGAMAMSVVNSPAATAGVASVPTPIAEEDDDTFFLWQPFLASIDFASAIGFIGTRWMRYDFDSKAQRKVVDGNTIIVTLENASSLHGMEYVIKFRQLHLLV